MGPITILALNAENDVYSWGYGDMLALGHGKEKDEDAPKKIPIDIPSSVQTFRCTRLRAEASTLPCWPRCRRRLRLLVKELKRSGCC